MVTITVIATNQTKPGTSDPTANPTAICLQSRLCYLMLNQTAPKGDATTIVPIYGLGGMGKTTLAGLVYNGTGFQQYDHRIWVFASQEFDLKKIGRSIISQIQTGGQQNTETLQLINRCLDNLIPGKKILIVLDDIWEENDSELERLKSMMHHLGKKGSMVDVIVTTRSEYIANKICTTEPYKLQPLKDDICWDIIKRYSQGEYNKCANKEQLEQIGLSIAKKCGGVALAAQAIGCILRNKKLHEWSELNSSNIWNEFPGVDNSRHIKVLPSLKLSYVRMIPILRLCFSYCAIFRKGQDIIEDDLIHQWVALDFINPSEGKVYAKQLLEMSFLQHSKLPLVSTKGVVLYTMHDLLHDLARSVVGDELIVSGAAEKRNTSEHKYCQYASLQNYDGQIKLSNILPKRVRALRFSDSCKLDIPGASFSFAKCLRIMDFSYCSNLLLPASIGQLKQLRCLIAPRMQNETLPECLTKLSKLQYLNLHGSTQISALPELIGELGCLTYLALSGCSSISKLPKSFGDLKNMAHLDMSGCSELRELPESFGDLKNMAHLDMSGCSELRELPESFGDLKNMEHLYMSGCSELRELPDSLGNLANLKNLNLSKCFSLKTIPESLCCLTQLQCLDLSSCSYLGRLPKDIGNLIGLQHLDISCCYRIRELPESFEKLRSLLHLDLGSCSSIEKGLPGALRGLTSLQHLDMRFLNRYRSDRDCMSGHGDLSDTLANLTDLKFLSIQHSMTPLFGKEKSDRHVDFIGSLTSLEHLDLSHYDGHFYLPESIANLKRLRQLNLAKCSDEVIDQANSRLHYSLTLSLFKARANGGSDCSNLHQLEGVDPAQLNICCLENVRSPEEAHGIKLANKRSLSILSLDWTLDANRLVEDKDLLEQLVPPIGLQSLSLDGYSSADFPMWSQDISHHLPNLVHIGLWSLPKCSTLPPLGQLPNLEDLILSELPSITKIDKDLCGGKRAFPRLSDFILQSMEGLEEWNTTYSDEDGAVVFMFPVLDTLSIYFCPVLRLKPCPPIFRECLIQDSDQVVSSLGEVDNLSHLSSAKTRELNVGLSKCRSMRLLHNLPTLEKLSLSHCNNLTGLPESMRHLSSLKSLKLYCCGNISALPEWLDDFSSLTSLDILRCPLIESLPPCIQQLIKLRKLHI